MYSQTLTNVQLELMKLFSTNLADDELLALKSVLANFFTKKAVAGADEVWDAQLWTDDTMAQWLEDDDYDKK